MKKIILILVCSLTIFGCSSNDESKNNTPQELIGKWKFVGYYDDVANEPDGSNFHPLDNGDFIIFNNNNTFISGNNAIAINNGSYHVSSNMIMALNYNATTNMPATTYNVKITLLSDSVLECYVINDNLGFYSISKYVKVTD